MGKGTYEINQVPKPLMQVHQILLMVIQLLAYTQQPCFQPSSFVFFVAYFLRYVLIPFSFPYSVTFSSGFRYAWNEIKEAV